MNWLSGRSRGWAMALLALAAGALFFATVSHMWPLIPGELAENAHDWRASAAALDHLIGTRLERYQMESRIRVDAAGLDCVERAIGRERTTALIANQDMPLAWRRVTFKEPGNPDSVTVNILLNGHLMGWERTVQEDLSGLEPSDEPEELARDAALRLVPDLQQYQVIERDVKTMPNRTDRRWTFERVWEGTGDPPLRERLEVVLAGDRVAKAMRAMVVPGPAARDGRKRRAPIDGLEALGFSLFSLATIAAAIVALGRLARGEARLGPASILTMVVASLQALTHLLQPAIYFELWDPLWPRWISVGRNLAYDLIDDGTVLLPLFFFMIAGDALDRLSRRDGAPAPQRAATLWALGRGRLAEPGVIAASGRGFLIGAFCGGVLAAGTLLSVWLLGARVQLQPRGFFFYSLNSSAPTLITVCFFSHIALLEELGYRFFAGTWLERLFGSRILAVLLPAVVYGLCHTAFEFLPPADPFWVRPLLLTAVGSVWGWAFFRYDALTVVLSHLTCDLFIFNYPALASGGWPAAKAVLAISLPLWPAIAGAAWRRLQPPQVPTHRPEL